jgi:ribosome-binding factor A
MTRRMEKVSDLIQSTLAEFIRLRVKDPAIADVMVSITRVDVSPDLANARVFVSVLGSDEAEPERAVESLQHAEPFLHRELVRALHMRRVPRLQFRLDRSIEEGDRLTRLMRDVARSEGRDL